MARLNALYEEAEAIEKRFVESGYSEDPSITYEIDHLREIAEPPRTPVPTERCVYVLRICEPFALIYVT